MPRQKVPDNLKMDYQITFTLQRDMGVRFATVCKDIREESMQAVLRDLVRSHVECMEENREEFLAEKQQPIPHVLVNSIPHVPIPPPPLTSPGMAALLRKYKDYE